MSIADIRSSIGASRLELAHAAAMLHRLQSRVLESSIRILEQTMHGSVSRATKAKAEYLSVVAEGMSKKLMLQQGQMMSQLYTAEVQEALKQKSGDLLEESRLWSRQIAAADGRLGSFQVVNGIESIANEYAEILTESQRIRDEIITLEQRR